MAVADIPFVTHRCGRQPSHQVRCGEHSFPLGSQDFRVVALELSVVSRLNELLAGLLRHTEHWLRLISDAYAFAQVPQGRSVVSVDTGGGREPRVN